MLSRANLRRFFGSSPLPAATRTDLYSRLVALCAEFQARGDLGCEVALDECHTKFNEELSEVLFRTVRELLTNVRQHAKATRVLVASSQRRDGSIGILVADDGIGLPAHRRRGNPFDESGGIGLWSIDQRLRAFDAVLDVDAAEGHGTRAMVILPGNLVVAD
jgi:signal transduction histidine kinase